MAFFMFFPFSVDQAKPVDRCEAARRNAVMSCRRDAGKHSTPSYNTRRHHINFPSDTFPESPP
jgi:hypothetical protein